jgi:hypothetical protein
VPLAATVNVAVCPTVTAWLAGCVVMEGATEDVVPVPANDIICGLLGALSVRVRVPARAPAAVGVNFTLMVQLDPTAIELPQVPTPAKPKSPVKAALNATVAVLLFVAVMNCAALLVPTVWLPKLNDVGERVKPVEAEFTVSVAALLVALPATLLTTTVNCAPLSELVVAGVV